MGTPVPLPDNTSPKVLAPGFPEDEHFFAESILSFVGEWESVRQTHKPPGSVRK